MSSHAVPVAWSLLARSSVTAPKSDGPDSRPMADVPKTPDASTPGTTAEPRMPYRNGWFGTTIDEVRRTRRRMGQHDRLHTTQHLTGGAPEIADSWRPGVRLSVLVHHSEGAEAFALTEGSPIVIGRELLEERGVREPRLSRQHARFCLRDGRVFVEDLGSTNGTWVDGTRIEEREVEPGVEIVLGGVIACVHALSAAGPSARGISGHAAFRTSLSSEIVRARFLGRELAMVMCSPLEPGKDRLASWTRVVLDRLRPIDLAALYSSDTLEILLPEMTTAAAAELATAVAGGESGLRVGVAAFPDPASSPEAMLEHARRALQRAGRERPVVVASRAGAAATDPAWDELAGAGQPISDSPAFASVLATAKRLARGVIPVLILGETGSGKEVLARFIHEQGPRKSQPLVAVNCAALPSQLVESTLFGHERGAFTGATQQQRGVFEAADGGSVLLDEIGELPAAAQAALLRVLETKRVTRVGSTKEIAVDVRVMAATHRDLEAMCDAGEFRRDLFYRLNTMTLRVPPLRKRREDIPELARRFLADANVANGTNIRGIEPEALGLLDGHPWPGNVRELRNAVERAVVIAQADTITVEDLPEDVQRCIEEREESQAAVGDGGEGDFRSQLERAEVEILTRALQRAGHNQTLAAKQLGMPLRTLVYKLRAHGIRRRP